MTWWRTWKMAIFIRLIPWMTGWRYINIYAPGDPETALIKAVIVADSMETIEDLISGRTTAAKSAHEPFTRGSGIRLTSEEIEAEGDL